MSLGLPYMGSKRKLAKPIIDLIIANNPNARYFYDLFGGGGAISFEALQRPQFDRVIYNELNTGVVTLLRKIMADGVTDDFYRWVDRDTFNAHKKVTIGLAVFVRLFGALETTKELICTANT